MKGGKGFVSPWPPYLYPLPRGKNRKLKHHWEAMGSPGGPRDPPRAPGLFFFSAIFFPPSSKLAEYILLCNLFTGFLSLHVLYKRETKYYFLAGGDRFSTRQWSKWQDRKVFFFSFFFVFCVFGLRNQDFGPFVNILDWLAEHYTQDAKPV
jgi:hypothetical protein